MSAVVIRELVKHFGDNTVVNRINLDIQPGEFVSLLGPSGCGKTTTLRMIAGLLRPDGGEIVVHGQTYNSDRVFVPPEKRNMSLIFQSFAIWPHMTVNENVAFGLKLRKVPKAETIERVKRILRAVQLDGLGERYPGELSGGQQQRAALARALVVEPQILLLDEPLSNLDANLREEMRIEIRRLHDQFKITSVYVTHDQTEAMSLSDRVVVMNHGVIHQDGPPEEVFEQPATEFVTLFLGRTNALRGTLTEPGLVRCADLTVRGTMTGAQVRVGEPVLVSIRPHDMTLTQAPAAAATNGATNRLEGIVEQAVYLGESVEHWVRLHSAPDVRMRVYTHPGQRFAFGQDVVLEIDVDKCRIVPSADIETLEATGVGSA